LLCEILKCVVYADPKRSRGRGIESGMQKIKMKFQSGGANCGSLKKFNDHDEKNIM
jgi:hypothetical protein